MDVFEQQPQEWTGIPADRPSRPSPAWLLFATIIGALIGGALVYYAVDTSPDDESAASTDAVDATTTVASDSTPTTVPDTIGSALDLVRWTTYPVEGSATGFITLTDGSAEEAVDGSAAALVVEVAEAIPANLDGDDIDDAVAILSVSNGATGVFYYAYGVFADSEQHLVTNAVLLGDRIAIDSVASDPESGAVTVRYRDHSEEIAFADPPDLQVVSDLQILRFGAEEVARGSIALADVGDPLLTTAATITTGGLGPVRVGMTVEEATAAAGLAMIAPTDSAPAASPGCGFARVDGFDGVGFMLIDGVIARVDVFSGSTSTASGAQIGSTEDEIKTLFPDVITVSPHQYVDGNYLTLTPTAENLTDFRVVFETDGQVVTGYRAGRVPQVEWIEGCA